MKKPVKAMNKQKKGCVKFPSFTRTKKTARSTKDAHRKITKTQNISTDETSDDENSDNNNSNFNTQVPSTYHLMMQDIFKFPAKDQRRPSQIHKVHIKDDMLCILMTISKPSP